MHSTREGTHNLFVARTNDIDDERYYPPLYQKVDRTLQDGYAVVYGLEPEPQVTIERMSRYGINANGFIREGALSVFGRDMILTLSSTSDDGRKLSENLLSLALNVQKDRHKGVSLMLYSHNAFSASPTKHLGYEKTINEMLDQKTELTCFYTNDTLTNMSLERILALVDCHPNLITKDWIYSRAKDAAINAIKEELDNVLGPKTGHLVLKTIQMVYDINEDVICLEPKRFEDTLVKTLGQPVSSKVLSLIKDRLRQTLFYD